MTALAVRQCAVIAPGSPQPPRGPQSRAVARGAPTRGLFLVALLPQLGASSPVVDEPIANLCEIDARLGRKVLFLLFGRIRIVQVILEPAFHDIRRLLGQVAPFAGFGQLVVIDGRP